MRLPPNPHAAKGVVGLVGLFGLACAPVARGAGLTDLPPQQFTQLIYYFLAFTAIVAVLIFLALNHLLRRNRSPRLGRPDRFLDLVDAGLGDKPADETLMEVIGTCLDNQLYTRALGYLGRLGSEVGESHRARFYRILALLGSARRQEATALFEGMPKEALGPRERERLRLAFREHSTLSRVQGFLMGIFLTDISLAESVIGRGDASRGLPEALAYLARDLPDRYRELIYLVNESRTHLLSAFDVDLNRRVRLRIMDPQHVDEKTLSAFIRRAQIHGGVEQASVVRVYDVHREGLPCYALEEVDGVSLEDWSSQAGHDLLVRSSIFLQVWDILRSLLGSRSSSEEAAGVAFPDRNDFVVDSTGNVRVRDLSLHDRTHSNLFTRVIAECHRCLVPDSVTLLSEDSSSEFLRLAHRRISDRIAAPIRADLVADLADAIREISRYLVLSQREREAEILMHNLALIDDLHRSRVHALKSKFAVSERYRGNPEKLILTFFRPANISQIARLLEGLAHQIPMIESVPPAGGVVGVRELLGNLPVNEMISFVNAPSHGTSAVGRLETYSQQFRDLSGEMSRVVESHDVELMHVIQSVASHSVWSDRIDLRSKISGSRLRVAHPEDFEKEFAIALDNLIANAFEANAKQVIIEVSDTSTGPYLLIRLTDDGDGVPPRFIERIRRDRFTTKANGTSTGVNHALDLVDKLAGSLDFGPRPEGGGTVVSIHLPHPRRNCP